MTRKHHYQTLFWNAVIIMSLLYSALAMLLNIPMSYPPSLFSLYEYFFLPSIIVYSLASRAVGKIKSSHPEIPEDKWVNLEHYPNPLKNIIINWCFTIWLFLILCSGPLYLWFFMAEKHDYIRVLGIVFWILIEIAWIFFFVHYLLYIYRFLCQVDQLLEQYEIPSKKSTSKY